ncbi:hypothetical protein [Thalassotalea crassostreae]|uniref:hypothetical protein n=1 Tax=Thalassotalea crassostreae TaxID=1763536 RepID=UPI0008395562|nr:hypothetical protein [Thalassotalea crassostreae]
MNQLEALGVGIRLLGIFLLAFLIRDIPIAFETLSQYKKFNSSGSNGMTFYAAMSIFGVLISLLMIKFPTFIAQMLVAKSSAKSAELKGDIETFQTTGIIILGIYILSWAIPDLIHNIISLWQSKEYRPNDAENFMQ